MKMNVYGGRVIEDPANPKVKEVSNILAIAWQLAHTCRWGGAGNQFYSVARHSINVANGLPPELMMEGLLHDASEAYLCDMPKPVKVLLPDYCALEEKYMRAIAEGFKLRYPFDDQVKAADIFNAELEAVALFEKNVPCALIPFFQSNPIADYHAFLEKYNQISLMYEGWL